ncbi:hypothetical protein VPH35_138031 [Triticum aestivum]
MSHPPSQPQTRPHISATGAPNRPRPASPPRNPPPIRVTSHLSRRFAEAKKRIKISPPPFLPPISALPKTPPPNPQSREHARTRIQPYSDSHETLTLANSYNQNFKGSYCTCSRPYPDPEAKEQVEMIQCCICEDWFHEDHIGLDSLEKIPRDEEGEPLYEEFICHQCSPVCYFLKLYPDTIWASSKQSSASEAVTADSNGMEGGSSGHADTEKNENGAPVDRQSIENTSVEENCTKDIAASDKSILGDNSGGNCKIGVDINTTSADSEKTMPFFMSKGWRETLCKCGTCTNFYAQRGIAHLTDKEDSIEEYEKIAKQKREKKLEQQEGAEANFINSLNHVQKIEILSGINDMKNEFQSFMESFDPSKPVTSDDVKSIFENLARKKQRLS